MKKIIPSAFSDKIVTVISALLIVLFAYTAINKFIDHAAFIDVLHESPIVKGFASFMSWAIPLTECVIVLGLLSSFRLIALYAALALVFTFTIYILVMMLSNSKLPCSCGGFIKHLSWNQHLFLNITIVIACMIAIFLDTHVSSNIHTRKPFAYRPQ